MKKLFTCVEDMIDHANALYTGLSPIERHEHLSMLIELFDMSMELNNHYGANGIPWRVACYERRDAE